MKTIVAKKRSIANNNRCNQPKIAKKIQYQHPMGATGGVGRGGGPAPPPGNALSQQLPWNMGGVAAPVSGVNASQQEIMETDTSVDCFVSPSPIIQTKKPERS